MYRKNIVNGIYWTLSRFVEQIIDVDRNAVVSLRHPYWLTEIVKQIRQADEPNLETEEQWDDDLVFAEPDLPSHKKALAARNVVKCYERK